MATEAIYTKSLGGAEDLLLDASNSATVIQTRAGKELEITKINSSTIPYSGKFGDPSMVSIKDHLDTKANTVSSAYVINTVDDFGTVPSGIDTVIVKDLNRGGTFIYDATQSAVNNAGTIFDGWVRKYLGTVNIKWFGAVDGADIYPIWETFITECYRTKTKGLVDPDTFYTTSDSLYIRKSGVTIEFNGAGYINLTSPTSNGAVLVVLGTDLDIVENVTLIRPKINGGNSGYPTSSRYGENGVAGAKCKGVRVIGGSAINCREGLNGFGSGGKGIQFEAGVEDIFVQDFVSENCSTGFEAQGLEDVGSDVHHSTSIFYSNIVAKNCERAVKLVQTESPPSELPSANQIIINGLSIINCGIDVNTAADGNGVIVLDRAYNVHMTNVSVYNSSTFGTANCILRVLMGGNCNIDIRATGNFDRLINNTIPTSGGASGSLTGLNISIDHIGTCDYLIGSEGVSNMTKSNFMFKSDIVNIEFVKASSSSTSNYAEVIDSAGHKIVSTLTGLVGIKSIPFQFETRTGNALIQDIVISSAATDITFGTTNLTGSLPGRDIQFRIADENRMKLTSTGLILQTIPISDPHVAGQLWNNSGVLNISAG